MIELLFFLIIFISHIKKMSRKLRKQFYHFAGAGRFYVCIVFFVRSSYGLS